MLSFSRDRIPALRLAAAALSVVLFAGCNASKPTQPAAEQSTGQVIAKVGSEDVTIYELQNEFRHAGVSPDKVNDDVTRAILSQLVRRKALAQRARAANLDREPTVLLDLLRSRDQVLATALLQRDIQAKTGAISKADLDRYINANPDRFGKRTRFDVEQFTVANQNMSRPFLEAVKDANSLDAIEAKAEELRVPYSRGAGMLFSGDLPPDLLTRLRARKDTDVFFVRTANAGVFFKVRSETPDPLTDAAAQQRAQVLMRNETVQSEIAKKGDDADVTYLGDYEKIMKKAAATGAAAPAGQPAATPPAANPAPAPAQ